LLVSLVLRRLGAEIADGKSLTGALQLRSNVGLHLDKDATILFSTDPADYPVVLTRWEGTECMNFCGLLTGRDLHDISITGEGTIDGQGSAWWGWAKKAQAKQLRELGETPTIPRSASSAPPKRRFVPVSSSRSTPSEFCWKA